ncbi:hypothetical protein ACTTXG_003543 [Acinetobacter baumannii]|uniref:hypothetical protein n=1 Tax=Acinetobacter baumannii TaxID=470 RepID=UPI00070B40D6|nr:hypothetical protein [Acinetobacter baumannii]EJD6088948.1 hypothetical protein [Acinetobacter baumannii]EJN6996513.1 hypothetical protein [Acinetobacter baumannii]EKU2033025.1 hypothetical protein [Acinetobacter baumannii]EKU2075563.1 hypothetical protein [Acinetobacter baumannii]EKU2652067.1 hypothetical protein [Acinetobacter baumannii]
MKPEQFIREFGVEKAREVIEAAIDGSTHVIYKQADGLINLKDLKRLVESLDRIAQLGGLSKAKDHLAYLISFGSEFAGVSKDEIKELQQDVAVHESIYGGGDE